MERDEYTDRYVNPYTDFGFKKLFGTEMNKELLISFINSLLSDKEQIRDLTYLNTENLGISEADRKAVFDVYCETDSGEKILVEMQLGQQLFFKERSLYYASFPIQQQGKHGDWNYQLKAVYVIAILNFVFDHIHDGYFHHEVQLTDSKTREVFYDKLTFIYLEMPKFNKKEEELDSMFDKWLFVLRNLTRLMEKPATLQERVFTRFFEAAEIAKFTVEEYHHYETSLKVYRDWRNTIDFAVQKATKEGEQKGIQIGMQEGIQKGMQEGIEKGIEKGKEEEFAFLELLEERAIATFGRVKNNGKTVSSNIDFYSGFVYEMIGLPQEIFTPLFAMARIVGWCAHRNEELNFEGKRIIRPAYKNVLDDLAYIPIKKR